MIQYTLAQVEDHRAIAQLHTLNWQHEYRGMFRDEYLDNEVEADRLKVWKERLSQASSNQFLQIAQLGDQFMGFVCLYYEYDEGYAGAYLDNLHVAPEAKRKGIGKQLFLNAAKWVYQRSPEREFYLWVLEENVSAIPFYDYLGGQAETPIEKELPDGGRGNVIRYVWKDLAELVRK